MSTGSPQVRGWIEATDHGAQGDGVHDDTAALQAAIDAAPQGGTVHIGFGRYRLTAPLKLVGDVTLLGDGACGVYGSIGRNWNSINLPTAPPWITGTVLIQSTPGVNILNLGGAGRTQHLQGLGLLFDGEHQFTDTGHGIHGVPPVHEQGYDNGVSGANWSNIIVLGHDGDHYAAHLTNAIYLDVRALHGFGGGTLCLVNDSSIDAHYGNANITSLYGQVFVGGSADGIRLQGTTHMLNLISFVRPQVTVNDMSESFPGITPASTDQQMLRSVGDVRFVSMLQPDFETGIGASITPPSQNCWMDPAGLFPRT